MPEVQNQNAVQNNPQAAPNAEQTKSASAPAEAPTAPAKEDKDNKKSDTKTNPKDKKTTGKNEKEKKMPSFSYTVINAVGKKETGTFDADTLAEAKNFIESLGYKVLEVKPRSAYDIDIGGAGKLKAGDLSFALTQLSTYIKSGIPLADSVKILAKQTANKGQKKLYYQLVYELLRGENLSDAMIKQGKAFPSLLINMVKTSELTGDLPSILDDMSEYYTSMDKTKKQMKSAMTYPLVVLTLAIGVLVFMLVFLVPQFAAMFESNDAKLPGMTLFVMGASDFIKNNYIILIIGIIVVVVTFMILYNKVQGFRKAVQVLLMHIPVVKNVIIYNEIANFTKTFASLINHGVFITDSMEILSKITNNEVYKKIISDTLVYLAKGDSVSTAFRGQWAVPVVAYEMIVTGENTGRLGEMMEKVADHFQSLHKGIIDTMKSLIEPLMIVMLAGIVGVILLSIIQPMFSIYDQVK